MLIDKREIERVKRANELANYYVGIYDSNPSTGDKRVFEQVNEVAGEYGAIIRDKEVVALAFVGRGNVTDDFGNTVLYRAGKFSSR